jgi:RNA polymerase sigma factor (sigma-70 family)
MTISDTRTLTHAIAQLALGSSADAVEVVQRRLGAEILRLCRRITGDHGLAADACQNTLLHVISEAAQFRAQGGDTEADIRRWTLRIATTTALALMRARRRQQARELRWGWQQARAACARDPAQVVAAHEDQERVRAAVEQLPEPYRTTLVLRFLSEMSVHEVALALDAPAESVRTRLRRGLAALRDRLRRDGITLGVGAALRSMAADAPRASRALRSGQSLLCASKIATPYIGISPMHLIPSFAIAASLAVGATLAAAESAPATAASATAATASPGSFSVMQVVGFDDRHQPILRSDRGRTITLQSAATASGLRIELADGSTKAPSALALGDRLRLTFDDGDQAALDGWATVTAVNGTHLRLRGDAGWTRTIDAPWTKDERIAIGARMHLGDSPAGAPVKVTVIGKDATRIHLRFADDSECFIPLVVSNPSAGWAVGSTQTLELAPGSPVPGSHPLAAPTGARVDRAPDGDLVLVFDNGERVDVTAARKTGAPVLHYGEVYAVDSSGSSYRLARVPTVAQ